ncbi:hypothetical protein [Flavobacterium sp. '19STA2R22 D10 B1']|uniref:hypothetical protein n=1 Tax=Flavobacterium aerium TaxID=3037261 RepID=UPI00278BF535|nr:hypothetical protein [Flavobacterium sp. '19STA2R22 D10 B1']
MNLTKIDSSIFKTSTFPIENGIVTIITVENSIIIGQQMDGFIAANLYERGGSYKVVYLMIDSTGLLQDVYAESEGILPTLFKAPDQTIWVSVIPYHPDKEMEISIPLLERSSVEIPKQNRPFVGDFIGINENSSFFISNDIFSTNKPDKFLRIEFKDGKIKKKHNLKIELPSQNKAIVSNNQIHLIAQDHKKLIHRMIDDTGKTLEQRVIAVGAYNFTNPISLSFTTDTKIICTKKKSIYLITITADNKVEETELLNLGHEIYNLWDGISLSDTTTLFQFTYELGNGWFIVRDQTIVECFLTKKNTEYQDLIHNTVIDLKTKNLVLSGVSKTENDAFALSFYPTSEKSEKNKTIVILNRKI